MLGAARNGKKPRALPAASPTITSYPLRGRMVEIEKPLPVSEDMPVLGRVRGPGATSVEVGRSAERISNDEPDSVHSKRARPDS